MVVSKASFQVGREQLASAVGSSGPNNVGCLLVPSNHSSAPQNMAFLGDSHVDYIGEGVHVLYQSGSGMHGYICMQPLLLDECYSATKSAETLVFFTAQHMYIATPCAHKLDEKVNGEEHRQNSP